MEIWNKFKLKGWMDKKEICELNVDLKERNFFILITCVTGDEIAEVYVEDYEWSSFKLFKKFDPFASNRIENHLDGIYIIKEENFEQWQEDPNFKPTWILNSHDFLD